MRRWWILGVGVLVWGQAPSVAAQPAPTAATASVATSSVARPPPPPRRPRRKVRRTRRRRPKLPLNRVRPWRPSDTVVTLRPTWAYSRRPQLLFRNPFATGPKKKDDLPGSKVWSEALWAVLWVLGWAFVGLRALSWLVRRLARRGVRIAQFVERVWRLFEGLAWISVLFWVLNRLASGPGWGPAAVATAGFILVFILAFNAIRDVVAGLLLNLERPFEVGDYVRVAEAEGQVRAFRTRVVELTAPDGHRLFVPYRALAGTTDVRPGGARRAHATQVALPVPDGVDPLEAMALAEEVARGSPWALLTADPRTSVATAGTVTMVELEAFAFDARAQSLLQAELLRSWAIACRKLT